MSAAGRQVWISVTARVVATMTMLGIVGWNGGHPRPYDWALVIILIISCVLACKKLGPAKRGQWQAARETSDLKDGSNR